LSFTISAGGNTIPINSTNALIVILKDKDMINKPGNEQFIDEVTAIMREADPIFEKSGSSTRHYVRDLLLPMMEEKGLLIVRKEEAPQPVPAPKVGEEDPILTRLDIAVIKEKLTDEISEALDIPDGDYDMDYMRGRKAGLEWALEILLKRDRIPALPATPETEQPGESEGGEVPEEVKDWIDQYAECDADDDNTLWRNGALAMYHRDQSTITALQKERDAYKDKWERAQKDIAALTEQIKAQ
jgi:hypothetical protein